MATKRRHWILTAGILVSTSGCGLTLAEHGLDSSASSEPRLLAAGGPKYVEATVEFCLPPDMPAEFEPKSSQGVSSYRPVARIGSPSSIMLVQATEPQSQTPVPPVKKAPEPVQKSPIFRSASAQEIYTAGSVPPPPRIEAAGTSQPAACASHPSAWGRWRQRVHDCIASYYADFSYTKLGQFLYEQGRTMVANGDASRMVLYDYDFIEGGAALNTRGKDQLAKIQAMLPQNFFPLVIERTPDAPKLAQSRRQLVLKELAKSTFPIPPERVVIGQSTADGLRGVEAVIIHQNLITQTQNSGTHLGQSVTGVGAGGINITNQVQSQSGAQAGGQ